MLLLLGPLLLRRQPKSFEQILYTRDLRNVGSWGLLHRGCTAYAHTSLRPCDNRRMDSLALDCSARDISNSLRLDPVAALDLVLEEFQSPKSAKGGLKSLIGQDDSPLASTVDLSDHVLIASGRPVLIMQCVAVSKRFLPGPAYDLLQHH